MRVNLADVGEGFDPIPAGKYMLRVANGELRQAKLDGEAKHPGSWYINWDLVVTQGDFAERHLFDNTSFAHEIDGEGCDCDQAETFGKALFKLKGLLAATGVWSKQQLDSPDFEFELDDVIGAELVGNVIVRKSEQYGDGNNIRAYRPASEAIDAGSSLLP